MFFWPESIVYFLVLSNCSMIKNDLIALYNCDESKRKISIILRWLQGGNPFHWRLLIDSGAPLSCFVLDILRPCHLECVVGILQFSSSFYCKYHLLYDNIKFGKLSIKINVAKIAYIRYICREQQGKDFESI